MTNLCARGCTVNGHHLDTCVETYPSAALLARIFGPTCTGCLPAYADDGLRVCGRDARNITAHLRSIIDPTKATVYDREPVTTSRVFAPAPADVNAIDAVDDIATTVIGQAARHGDSTDYGEWAVHVPPTADAVDTHDVVALAAKHLLDHLHPILTGPTAGEFAHAILDGERWTIRKALARWPIDAKRYRSKRDCPNCSARAIWVIPAPDGAGNTYLCAMCQHEPNADHYAGYFEGGLTLDELATTSERTTP